MRLDGTCSKILQAAGGDESLPLDLSSIQRKTLAQEIDRRPAIPVQDTGGPPFRKMARRRFIPVHFPPEDQPDDIRRMALVELCLLFRGYDVVGGRDDSFHRDSGGIVE